MPGDHSPVLPRASRQATDGEEETRAFLQKRLALIYAVLTVILAFISATNWALYAANILPAPARKSFPPLGVAFVLLTATVFGFWQRSRRGRISGKALARMDVVGILLIGYTVLIVTRQMQQGAEGAVFQIILMTYLLFARSILIPSRARTTFLVSLAIGVPTVISAAGIHAANTDGHFARDVLMLARPVGVTTFLATLASRVIYGLRRQAYEAEKVGQYLLRERIGQGGMGVVYRATHALLRRETAVKLLLPTKVGDVALARFEREVTMTARLTHPNAIAIFDYGRTPDGVFYYAMEYLEGGDLEDLVTYAGPLAPGRAVYLLDQVCRALVEAHAAGLIHRDLKPGNLLVCERGAEGDVAKVVDFGLVKDLHAEESGPQLTADQGILGTPLYMAPETIVNVAQASAASDIYALGAVAAYLLTGEPVFTARSMVEICGHHLYTPPEPPSVRRPGTSTALDTLILRCLAKKPEDRFASVKALREALLASPVETPWTADDAARWWAEHREPFRAHTLARRASRLIGTTDERLALDREGQRMAVRARAPSQ